MSVNATRGDRQTHEPDDLEDDMFGTLNNKSKKEKIKKADDTAFIDAVALSSVRRRLAFLTVISISLCRAGKYSAVLL